MQFLSEALHLLGSNHRVRIVQADSGFYADTRLYQISSRRDCPRKRLSRGCLLSYGNDSAEDVFLYGGRPSWNGMDDGSV